MDTVAIVRIFTALIIVIALILVCGWIARRRGVSSLSSNSTSLAITNKVAVGTRGMQIMVVEIEDTRLVIGVTRSSINILHTLAARSES